MGRISEGSRVEVWHLNEWHPATVDLVMDDDYEKPTGYNVTLDQPDKFGRTKISASAGRRFMSDDIRIPFWKMEKAA